MYLPQNRCVKKLFHNRIRCHGSDLSPVLETVRKFNKEVMKYSGKPGVSEGEVVAGKKVEWKVPYIFLLAAAVAAYPLLSGQTNSLHRRILPIRPHNKLFHSFLPSSLPYFRLDFRGDVGDRHANLVPPSSLWQFCMNWMRLAPSKVAFTCQNSQSLKSVNPDRNSFNFVRDTI